MKPRSELLPAIALIGVLALVVWIMARPIGPSAPAPQNGRMDVSGGDYQSLSYAVSRMFGTRVLPGLNTGRAALRVGALPPDMPFELVIPPGTTIVGSLYGEVPGEAQIALDTNAAQDDLVSVYENSLVGQGFVHEQPPVQMFSINSADQPPGSYNGSFCRSRDSVVVNLGILPRSGGPTQIAVYASWNYKTVSCLAVDPGGVYGVGARLIPSLVTPPGSLVSESGSGGGGELNEGVFYEEVQITFPTTPQKLADYLVPQLEAAGWSMTTSKVSDAGAWSTWTLKDAEGHPWTGALIVIASPVSNQSSIRVEVRRQ